MPNPKRDTQSKSASKDPVLDRLRQLWKEAKGNIKLQSKTLRLFTQFVRTNEGIPSNYHPEIQRMLDNLLKALPDMSLRDTQDAIPAIKYARRQLRTVASHGSAFRRDLTAAERAKAAVIGKRIEFTVVQGLEPTLSDTGGNGDDMRGELLRPDSP